MEEVNSTNPQVTQSAPTISPESTPNPNPKNAPSSKKQMLKTKEFWIVFIICAFLVLCVLNLVAYFGINVYRNMKGLEPLGNFTLPSTAPIQTANETANWKTYTNSEFGYSIKYPERIDERDYNPTDYSYLHFSLPPKDIFNLENFTIFNLPNSYESAKKAVDFHMNMAKANGKVTRSPYVLNGIKGEQVIEDSPPDFHSKNGWQNKSIWVQKGNTILVFSISYKPETKNESLSYFNQIISTLKFSNQVDSLISKTQSKADNSNPDISTWNTYINNDIGYSIKHPLTIDKVYYRSSVGSFVQIELPNLNDQLIISDIENSYDSFKEAQDVYVNQTLDEAKVERSPYILGGINGEYITEINSPGSVYINGTEKHTVSIQIGETLLNFSVSFTPEKKEQVLKYFNQILSTFKLTP